LLALPSLFVYPASISWGGSFWQQCRAFMNALSEDDPFDLEPFENDTTGATAAVLINSRLILVIFRGTEKSATDWRGNFRYGWRSVPDSWGDGIRVHRGFYDGLRSIYQDLRRHVRRHDNTRRVFIAGHSLGGALASLCGYRFQKVGSVDVQGVYSWGAPRVGNDIWASNFNATLPGRYYRWVRGADFGPRLPDVSGYPGPGQAYFHVGQLNYIHQDGKVVMNMPDFEPFGIPSSNDHDMKRYTFTMLHRLSNRRRSSDTSPDYLVERDVTHLKEVIDGRPLTTLIAATA
jgi:pimeloyl-ACP methyl ester carboxylesterase